jgi:hypothetical protein
MRRFTTLALMLAATTAIISLPAAPKSPQPICSKAWTIGGPRGSEPRWMRVNGYRVGMSKVAAANVDRHRLKNWMMHDVWRFESLPVRILLEFENGKLASGKMSLPASDYEYGKIYDDLVGLHGEPLDAGTGHAVWRGEECDTVKVLKDDGDNISIVIQSLERFERRRTPPTPD